MEPRGFRKREPEQASPSNMKTVVAAIAATVVIAAGCGVITVQSMDAMRHSAAVAVSQARSEKAAADVKPAQQGSASSSAVEQTRAADSVSSSVNSASSQVSVSSSSSSHEAGSSSEAGGGVPTDKDDSVDANASADSPSQGGSPSGESPQSQGGGAAVTPATSDTASSAAHDVYHIVWGDTLSSISSETGVSVDRIAQVNGIGDVNLIYADSALAIPSS